MHSLHTPFFKLMFTPLNNIYSVPNEPGRDLAVPMNTASLPSVSRVFLCIKMLLEGDLTSRVTLDKRHWQTWILMDPNEWVSEWVWMSEWVRKRERKREREKERKRERDRFFPLSLCFITCIFNMLPLILWHSKLLSRNMDTYTLAQDIDTVILIPWGRSAISPVTLAGLSPVTLHRERGIVL